MILAAIDPGKHLCGVSVIRHGAVVHTALIRVMPSERLTDTQRIQALADRCAESLALSPVGMPWVIDLLVVESQQIYRGSKENPNDLLPVAQVAGACLIRVPAKAKTLILPRDWTSGKPKEIRIAHAKAQAARSEGLLSTQNVSRLEDIKPRSLRHNAWDAALIAAWAWPRRAHLRSKP